MPTERGFDVILEDEIARLRVRFRRNGPTISAFTVQLEAWHQERWKPVRRYDTAHDQPHIDVLDTNGRTVDKRWLSGTNNEVLTLAVAEIKGNWRRYLAEFEGR